VSGTVISSKSKNAISLYIQLFHYPESSETYILRI